MQKKPTETVTRRKVENCEDLIVWQRGMKMVKQIYLISQDGLLNKDYGLREQLRRAALSILANIAEGYERTHRKEYLHFLNIAKGSAGEVRCLVRLAFELGYFDRKRHDSLLTEILELS